jgi:hypothetical protein
LGSYLVVLTDRRFPNDPDIRAVRYDRNGVRLDQDTFFIEGRTNPNDGSAVSPGRNGGWAVTYHDMSTGGGWSILWRHSSK